MTDRFDRDLVRRLYEEHARGLILLVDYLFRTYGMKQ